MNKQLEYHLETFDDSDEEYSEAPILHEDEHVEPINDQDGLRNSLNEFILQVKSHLRKFVKPKSLKDIFQKILLLLPMAIAIGDYIGIVLSTTLSFGAVILMQLKPERQQQQERERDQENILNGGFITEEPLQQERGTTRFLGGSLRRRIRNLRRTMSSDSNDTNFSSNDTGGGGDGGGGGNIIISNIQFLNDEELSLLYKKRKKQIFDCRKEVSRLLGLVGAPPLGWKALSDEDDQHVVRDDEDNHDDENNSNKNINDGMTTFQKLEQRKKQEELLLRISDTSMKTIIKFLEAHIQFLLTIDQAYQYLKLSTSLHLGLGANSQCTERVERAAIAKEFRNTSRRKKRKQSIGASLIRIGINSTKLQPQRAGSSTSNSNIMALGGVKTNLAKCMVEQSKSLIQVWKGIRLAVSSSSLSSSLSLGNIGTTTTTTAAAASTANDGYDDYLPTDMDILLLQMPVVVDLQWIKSSRLQLSKFLGHMMDYFCTMDVLQTLSSSTSNNNNNNGDSSIVDNTKSKLEESMYNVRNAREYLLCSMLLGKNPSVQPIMATAAATTTTTANNGDVDNMKLLQSLIQYRDQLDALNAAIWSCQWYTATTTAASGGEATGGDGGGGDDKNGNAAPVVDTKDRLQQTTNDGQEDEGETTMAEIVQQERRQWWSHVKRLGSTCRALEEEIGQRFDFLEEEEEANDNEVEVRQESGILATPTVNKEHEKYEHDNTEGENKNKTGETKQTKTMVFKGHGAVQKENDSKKSKSNNRKTKLGGDGETQVVPLPPRDTVSEQLMVSELKNRIQSLCPPDDDDEEEEEVIAEEEDAMDSKMIDLKHQKASHISNNSNSRQQQPEVTGTHFLGATGNLLNELKGSLPVVDADGEEVLGG